MSIETYPEVARRHYQEDVERVARRLRDLADEFERDALRITGPVNGCPPHTYAASRAHHTLVWGIANLSADKVIVSAGTADTATAGEGT